MALLSKAWCDMYLIIIYWRWLSSAQWPYTYDDCDVGTAPNQTLNGQPEAAIVGGDPTEGGALSFLPGQRLSRCTCSGESHPGPVHSDGTFVGRAAPEIDIFEAQVSGPPDGPLSGIVSQSSQWAVSRDVSSIQTDQTNIFSLLMQATIGSILQPILLYLILSILLWIRTRVVRINRPHLVLQSQVSFSFCLFKAVNLNSWRSRLLRERPGLCSCIWLWI